MLAPGVASSAAARGSACTSGSLACAAASCSASPRAAAAPGSLRGARAPGLPRSGARAEAGWSGRSTPPSQATLQQASQCSTSSQVAAGTLYGRPPLAPRSSHRASQPGDSTFRQGTAARSARRACPATRAPGAGQSPRRCACARASRPPSRRRRRRRRPPPAAASAGPPTPAHRLPQERALSPHNTAPARPAAASLAACCRPATV